MSNKITNFFSKKKTTTTNSHSSSEQSSLYENELDKVTCIFIFIFLYFFKTNSEKNLMINES